MKHAITALAFTLSAIAASSAAASEVIIATTGGAFEKAMVDNFFAPFEAETGIKVRTVSATVAEQITKLSLMAKAEKSEWDIVYLTDLDLKTDVKNYLLDLKNCEEIPNVAENGVKGACLRHGVISDFGGGVLAYDASALPEGKKPSGWPDFWDVATFPGPRSLPDAGVPWWDMSVALRAAGVPRDAIYPIDEQKAYAKLDEIKPHISVWWKTGDQSQNLFRTGEVTMALLTSGRALQLKKEGRPIEIIWSDALRDVGAFGVVANAPNPENAKRFLNYFYSRPEAHVKFGQTMFYGSPVKEAAQAIGLGDDALNAMIETDPVWVEQNREKSIETWTEWIAQ